MIRWWLAAAIVVASAQASGQCAGGHRGGSHGSGIASWYGSAHEGRATASGQQFRPTHLTAAHPTLPMGTRIRVTRGGASVVVTVLDRFCHPRRSLDLSEAAAVKLGMRDLGIARVRWTRVKHSHR